MATIAARGSVRGTVLKFTLTHSLLCSVDRYWRLFLDPGFTQTLLVDGLGFGRVEVGPLQPHGSDEQSRTMKVTPKLDLPGPVARVLGDALSYLEEGTYHAATQRWTYELRFNAVADRIQTGGVIYVEPDGDGCRRISELWFNAKVFGVGGLIERSARSNMETGFNKSAAWFDTWVKRHPEDSGETL